MSTTEPTHKDEAPRNSNSQIAQPQLPPEGRAAHPRMKHKQRVLLVAGSFIAVIAASITALLVWSPAAAAVVFVFGTALAIFGNPVVWAASQRDTTDSR